MQVGVGDQLREVTVKRGMQRRERLSGAFSIDDAGSRVVSKSSTEKRFPRHYHLKSRAERIKLSKKVKLGVQLKVNRT